MERTTNPDPTPGDTSHGDPTKTTERVISAVAAAEGVDPEALSTPLFDAVDPDALNRLFTPTSPWSPTAVRRVTFGYADYEVTVHADGGGDVTVEVFDGPSDPR